MENGLRIHENLSPWEQYTAHGLSTRIPHKHYSKVIDAVGFTLRHIYRENSSLADYQELLGYLNGMRPRSVFVADGDSKFPGVAIYGESPQEVKDATLNYQAELLEMGIINFQQSRGSMLPYYLSSRAIDLGLAEVQTPRVLRIVDMCAAPGNKSLNFLAKAGEYEKVEIVMNDLVRSDKLIARMADFGATYNDGAYFLNYRGTEYRLMITDYDAAGQGTVESFIEDLGGYQPDIVIADVPCAGDGMIAKRPTFAVMPQPRTPDDLTLQQGILVNAYSLVSNKGAISYSTCTFNPVANEGVLTAVGDFLAEAGMGFNYLDIASTDPEISHLVGKPLTSYTNYHREKVALDPQIRAARTSPARMEDGIFCAVMTR